MTVGEMRAALANLPEGMLIGTEPDRSEIYVYPDGNTGGRIDVERLQPGETLEAMEQRERETKAESRRQTADILRKFGFPTGE